MKRKTRNAVFAAIGAAALLLPQTMAGNFTADFNDNAPPAGTTTNGVNGAGLIESGILKLTTAANSQSGSLVIEDLDAGNPVYGFSLTTKIRVGGGTSTPADGFGITFSPLLSSTSRPGQDGIGSGITFTFDEYNNGTTENPSAPSIDVRVNGQVVAWKKVNFTDLQTGTNFVNLAVSVTADGAVSLSYKDVVIFDHVYFAGYQPIVGGRFALHANTGGLNENFWIDDLSITTFTTPQVGVVNPPKSQTLVPGATLSFNEIINNADAVTYQWLTNGVPIAGATDVIYSTPVTLADNGTKYTFKAIGPNNTVTTADATISVIDIPLPSTPTVSYDFNDGLIPAGSFTFGNGHIGEDAATIHLVDALASQSGGFIIEDIAAGQPVHGLTASFKALVGGGTATPADGFSFNFGPNIPNAPTGEMENGFGTGLTVGFDIYNNLDFEAPSIDVRFAGQLIASKLVPISFIATADQFVPVIIRLENDGTLDVVYNGTVVFNNLLLPGFTSFTGARVGFGARTGGATDNFWLDDIQLTAVTTPGPVRITTAPKPQFVLAGQTANFTVGVNDTTGVTYQWLRNGSPISSGGTSADYSLATVAGDSGATFSVSATRDGVTVTSAPVPLTVLTINPTVSFNFDDGLLPAGTFLTNNPTAGGGYITATGGVGDSGVLHLTDAVANQRGAFVVRPLLSGAELGAVNVAFDLRLGNSAVPADGFSFNFAPNLPEDTTIGEDGTGQGLTIAFDIYDNGNGDNAPSIDVRWKGTTLATTRFTIPEITTDVAGTPTFKTVVIRLSTDGKVDVSFGGRVVHSGVQIPGYTPISNGKFAFYGRTGGANENQWIDNLRIEAIKTIAPLRITQEPADALQLPGQTATFSVIVSDPAGVTFQWLSNGVAISGATSSTITTPVLSLANSGTHYSVTATGPGGAPVSRQATVTVVAPLTIGTPDVSFNFDDGVLPDGTTLNGHVDNTITNDVARGVAGYITTDGGVNNSGVVHLTDANNGQGGTFFIRNFNGEDPVSGFTANFKIRIGGGSAVPADGASFTWSAGINPDDTTLILGEDGNGSGLTIAFDIYDNGNGEAPAFDILWKGQNIATRKVPLAWLATDSFVDVMIRLESDGTVDVQHNGQAIFNNVQLPGFAPVVGAHFAIGARTGGLNANQWIDDVKIVTTSGPLLTVTQAPGAITLEWSTGTLQSAPSVLGPWTDLPTEVSPSTQNTTGTMKFFRVAR